MQIPRSQDGARGKTISDSDAKGTDRLRQLKDTLRHPGNGGATARVPGPLRVCLLLWWGEYGNQRCSIERSFVVSGRK